MSTILKEEKKYIFKCVNCNTIIQPIGIQYLCPKCEIENSIKLPPKGVLNTLYNFDNISKKVKTFKTLKDREYFDILPINSIESLGYLRVGRTPLYNIHKLNSENLNFELLLKDDSQNPTFSFKDRASILVSAFAKENNTNTIVAASTGNAGSSLAGICASQGQKAVIFVPSSAPIAKLTQIVMYGATIVTIDGNYDMAFDLSIAVSKHFGWFNRNTAYNPLTIEGKKTVSFELFDQLNEQIPDRIFVPVGDGVIISGVYKGFEDLLKLGFIEKMPVIIAVQSEGSKNLIANIKSKTWKTIPSTTLADSISVDIPRNFYMTRDYIQKYDGEIVAVSDDEIIDASRILSRNTGIFAEPAASAAFAGMLKYKSLNRITDGSKNVVLLTGSGLKDIKTLSSVITIPKPLKPEIDSIVDYLSDLKKI